MARKAVQGYPEKSYYDNTRYLGMIATTDPLQEGFFKHIVNFDISDTGQSVQPRDGFITTTFTNPSSTSLSNKTIIFKSADDSAYIIYDFMQKKGYRADLSAYNLTNQYLPIEATIAEFNWSNFITYLDETVPAVHSYYVGAGYNNTLTYVQSYLTIIPETKVEFIYDENGVRKTLVKAYLAIPNNPTITLTIQMYYRSDAVTINGIEYANGNVLIFECVDNFKHPTLVSSERNLSVSKSIIPDPMQILYASKPIGHNSNLGNFVYIYDDSNNYINNFMYRSINYNIKPYFSLNPAYYDLNNDVNTSDKWAYRLELFNTSTTVGDKTKDVSFSTPWFTYGNGNVPVEIFPKTNFDDLISLSSTDRSQNHYKGAKHVIFILPKTLYPSVSSKSYNSSTQTFTETFFGKDSLGNFVNYTTAPYFFFFSTIKSIQDTWLAELEKIKDKKSLIDVINTLSTSAVFYVYNLNTAPGGGKYSIFDESMQSTANSLTESFVIEKDSINDEYNLFLTGTQLIDRINTDGMFNNNNDIVFKLLPFGSNNTHLETTASVNFTSPVEFGDQQPYYVNSVPTTIYQYSYDQVVQVRSTGQVYKLGGVGPVWSALGTAYGSVGDRIQGVYYIDSRTNKKYKWENLNNDEGALTEVTTATTQKITYRWAFAALNYWNENGLNSGASNVYTMYHNAYNIFYRNNFPFVKFNWDTLKYDIQTDLTELKKYTTTSPISFTSESYFNNYSDQPPWYVTSIPSFIAPYNTVVQSSNGVYYRQTTSPSGSSWGTGIGGGTYPSTFTQGFLYKDTRNNRIYRWDNPTGTSGRMTFVGDANPDLVGNGFFDKGLSGIFYMRPYQTSELTNSYFSNDETIKLAWNTTSLVQSFNIQYGYDADEVTYIEKTITKEPEQILSSLNQLVFEDSRLLVWNKNVLYISEEGRYYWFKDRNKIEFGEDIVKVLQYKQIILVFTTQHLYAVYRVETTVTTVNPATNQLEQNVTGVAWLKQIVLYNLLVSKEYADVIQVFNEMVLFYSADGQLYMIRPSTAIDNETRFRIQFFNKAVNDVLQNYDVYMNERLAMYAKDTRVTKAQVKIKALVSINFIKMFYYVPGVMTYIVIYDVINNRYTVYDTLTFTNIYDKFFIESGDLYITEQNNKIYFTMHYVEPNVKDNHVDTTFTNNFKKEGINALIDTGNLNLNNHLNKRFRDLHVVFKNLNSSNLLFNLETHIDDIVAKPFYNEQLEVQEINGASYFVSIPKLNDNDLIELVDVNQISETATDVLKYSLTNNLFENNNVLMDFSAFTSSKLLTHRTSILGLGKVFRFKLQFISKGLYKLQHFGIIYKERRI
jgi:hypothetical protein